MEENIGSGGSTDFFPLLTKHRQKLSELNAYYEQLTDIGELFQSRACSPFANDTQDWDKFTHRAERLQNHVKLLRENMLQLRELINLCRMRGKIRLWGFSQSSPPFSCLLL